MDEQMVNELFTPHNWENYTDDARSIFIAIHEEQLEGGKEFVSASDAIRRALSRIGNGLSKSAEEALERYSGKRDVDVQDVYEIMLGLARHKSKFQMIETQGNPTTLCNGCGRVTKFFCIGHRF